MIRTLRRKFIGIAMLSVISVLVLLVGIMDILNYREVRQNISSEMALLESYDGDLSGFDREAAPEKPEGDKKPIPPKESRAFEEGMDRGRISRETPFSLRYFTVSYSADEICSEVNVNRIASVSEEDAKEIAGEIKALAGTRGFYKDFYYSVITVYDAEGTSFTKYIFLDCSRDFLSFRRFRNISIIVSALGVGLVFLMVLFLSRIAMKPVAESYEKQKHFITDASHEIKTPLAIIEANTEVLEMTEGENEWLKSIRHQISRLSSLTEKLVFLSRMDEESTRLQMGEFSLSDAVTEVAESFLPVAKAKDKKYEIRVEDGVACFGDRENLSRAISLLIENAMKYSDEGGQISVSLRRTSKNKKEIKVFNTVELIEVGRHDEYFERFYRADASRSSETGGHGIGLSVVKAIVRAHKGRVTAESKSATTIEFMILLP
ncbi:MAG: HAMP domain-containing histidine kinase [Lachnospiraceae bacterium]|nr:HAMP domain-containing histidine kinase [Lachnospiraceae bacterium]